MRILLNQTGANRVPFQSGIAEEDNHDYVTIQIYVSGAHHTDFQIKRIIDGLSQGAYSDWLAPVGDDWGINVEQLSLHYPELNDIPWFIGTVVVSPVVEAGGLRGPMGNFDSHGRGLAVMGDHPASVLSFLVTKETVEASNKVFYSWMSDHENFSNRGFVQDCLEKAIKRIANDDSLGILPSLDRDTKDEAGAPDIANSILAKISRSRAMVADVSLLKRDEGSSERRFPNPNVLIELGYAAGTLGWDKCLLVFNTAFGDVTELPFDIRGRRILTYRVNEREDRSSARESFIPLLETHLGTALAHQ